MKNRTIAFITVLGLFFSASLSAQMTDAVAIDDTTSTKAASPKTLPKYAAVNGYHAGNYKQHRKAAMAQPKTNLISSEAAEKKVSANYKMSHNKSDVKQVATTASSKKVVRNYKMPFNN